jgi:hypothetical protein
MRAKNDRGAAGLVVRYAFRVLRSNRIPASCLAMLSLPDARVSRCLDRELALMID